MHISVRVLPCPDKESLPSYVARVAGYNGYMSTSWLCSAARVPRDFVTRPCDLSGLVSILGDITDSATLASMAFWPSPTSSKLLRFGTSTVSPYSLSLQRSKYCPVCFAEDRVPPRVWTLLGYVACPYHSCLLRDDCPSCGDVLPFLHPYRLKCRCGASVMDTAVAPASSAAIALSRLLDALALGKRPLGSAAPVKDLEIAMRLIRFFGVADTGPNWRSKFISRPPVQEMVDHVERAAPLLLDWPAGLHAFVDNQRRRATEGVSLAAEFGPFLTRLRQAFDDPRCEEIIETVRQRIAGPTHRILTKRSSFYHTSSSRPIVMSAAAAGKLLGLTSRTVVRLIATGELQGESRKMGRRRAYFIESTCVEAFVQRRESSH
jgi:hypothetical protein